MERPHSRKKTIVEGTAEVKKGEKIEESVQAGEGGAPFSSVNENQEDEK